MWETAKENGASDTELNELRKDLNDIWDSLKNGGSITKIETVDEVVSYNDVELKQQLEYMV